MPWCNNTSVTSPKHSSYFRFKMSTNKNLEINGDKQVTFSLFSFSFLQTEIHASDLKVTVASAISQTLSLNFLSPLAPSAPFFKLLDMQKDHQCRCCYIPCKNLSNFLNVLLVFWLIYILSLFLYHFYLCACVLMEYLFSLVFLDG